MNKNIAEEFLPFFDKNLIKDFKVLPLEYDNNYLFVGITQEPELKIKRALEEIIPFKIKLYRIPEDFFKTQMEILEKNAEDFIVFDKKRLIFPIAKDLITEKTRPEDIIRFLIFLMIKEKKKFLLLTEKNLDNFSIPKYALGKVRRFFAKDSIYNPLPIKVEKNKLLLYFDLNKKGDIYLEILKENIKEKFTDELNNFFRKDNLIILGKNSDSLEFILYTLLKKQIMGKKAFLTGNKNIRFKDIETFYFSQKTFTKLLALLLKRDYDILIINGEIDLYPFMILGSKTKFIINLPLKSKEEFYKKVKKEKIEHVFKAKNDLKVLEVDIIRMEQEKIGGEKLKIFEIF